MCCNIQLTQQVQLEVIVVELIVAGGIDLNNLNNRLNIREKLYRYQAMCICLFHVCVSTRKQVSQMDANVQMTEWIS